MFYSGIEKKSQVKPGSNAYGASDVLLYTYTNKNFTGYMYAHKYVNIFKV